MDKVSVFFLNIGLVLNIERGIDANYSGIFFA